MDPYDRFILFVWFLGKMWKFSEKRPFFRADMAGLGKYHTGGYGRIGVYRVKINLKAEYNEKMLSVLYGVISNPHYSKNTKG